MAEKSKQPVTILVVEDDEVLLRALYLLLQGEGYAIASATDGETALSMARRIVPDLILLDLILPKMHGFDVLRDVKADPKIKDIPVVVLSNLGDRTDIDRAKDLGAADYFVKARTDLSVLAEQLKRIRASR